MICQEGVAHSLYRVMSAQAPVVFPCAITVSPSDASRRTLHCGIPVYRRETGIPHSRISDPYYVNIFLSDLQLGKRCQVSMAPAETLLAQADSLVRPILRNFDPPEPGFTFHANATAPFLLLHRHPLVHRCPPLIHVALKWGTRLHGVIVLLSLGDMHSPGQSGHIN